MKKVFLAMAIAFSLTTFAQTYGGAGGSDNFRCAMCVFHAVIVQVLEVCADNFSRRVAVIPSAGFGLWLLAVEGPSGRRRCCVRSATTRLADVAAP